MVPPAEFEQAHYAALTPQEQPICERHESRDGSQLIDSVIPLRQQLKNPDPAGMADRTEKVSLRLIKRHAHQNRLHNTDACIQMNISSCQSVSGPVTTTGLNQRTC
jgi:hypothetical protein